MHDAQKKKLAALLSQKFLNKDTLRNAQTRAPLAGGKLSLKGFTPKVKNDNKI